MLVADMDASPAFACVAIVPCAGRGARATAAASPGLVKQYVVVAGRPLVAHTLSALAQVHRLAHVLVVVAPDDQDAARLAILPAGDRRFSMAPAGGATRAASVAGGLAVLRERGLADDATWVLVHDAARCLVRAESVDALIDACLDDPVGGLLAAPVPDTLKRDDGADRIAATVPRTALWAAQTPQMFRLGLLETALARAGDDVTDEAGAVEALGHAPRLVAGPPDNWKVTHPADFALAERWLDARRERASA